MNKVYKAEPIHIGELVITPVSIQSIFARQFTHGHFVYFSSSPLGIIVSSGEKEWAITVEGKVVSINELLDSNT